jgi:hypothetical protein
LASPLRTVRSLPPPGPAWPPAPPAASAALWVPGLWVPGTFGKAFGASAYAASTCLTAAQHLGLAPETTLLQRQAAALVNRGRAPSTCFQRVTGVPNALLTGHPREGSFGLLPLREHVCACWAAAACRLIRLAVAPAPAATRPAPFWVLLASALFSAGPGGPSALSLCGARLRADTATELPSLAADPLRTGLPPPLQRLWSPLRSIGLLCTRRMSWRPWVESGTRTAQLRPSVPP